MATHLFAALQMTSKPSRQTCMNQAEKLISEAARKRARLVALPENFSHFVEGRRRVLPEAQTLSGEVVTTLKAWARRHRLWILGGTIAMKKGSKATNTSLLISPQGQIHTRYDKIHLFDVAVRGDKAYRESETYHAGRALKVARTPLGKLGMSVCFDLRFSELYRGLRRRGAEVLFIPSAFTHKTGQAHWDTLTRARAIENQCYVVAPGQSGSPFPGRLTWGHTRIIDPWGRVLDEKTRGPGVVLAKVDLGLVKEVRKQIPMG